MFVTELDTFVRKFHQLWNDGLTAHLDLDTHAGYAWVGLRVRLGQVPGPPHQQLFPQQVHRKVERPARQRRRDGRAAANSENTKNTEAEPTEVVVEKVPDVFKVQEETFDGKVSKIAEEATTDDNVVEGLIDEVCSDKEYTLKAFVRSNEDPTIPQFDGTFDEEVSYTFLSDFHYI